MESIFCLNQVAQEKSLSLQLTKVVEAPEFRFDFGYVPIGKQKS
jgi:hypothetical protein